MTLSGNWDSEVTQYLFFKVKIKPQYCRNSTDDHYCIGSRDFEEKDIGYSLMTLTNNGRF